MTPESGVLLGLVITISVCGIFTTCVCCMCCCVASVWNAMVEKIFGKNGPIFGNNKYQTVPPNSNFGYQDGSTGVAAAAVYAGTASYLQQSEGIPLVEAYVVPPLAAPRISDAHSLVHGAVEDGLSTSSPTRVAVTPGPKDIWAAVVFVINVIIIFSLAIQAVSTFNVSTDSSSSEDNFNLGKTGINFPMLSLYLTLTLFTISAAGSYLVYFFLNHGENIIDWVMKLNIAGLFVLAALSFITFNIFGAIVFGVFAGINMWYYYSVRNRIPFASSVLSAACTAVKANFTGLLLTSFAGLMFQGLWMLLWAIAIFGVYTSLSSSSNTSSNRGDASNDDQDEDSGAASAVSVLMLFSLYWGLQLIKDVVAVTAGGTVASWWFQPKHPAPVRGSLFRATTTSFGSICFGSMVVAAITTLRAIVKSVINDSRRHRGRPGHRNFFRVCILYTLEMLLACLESALRYINKYAYSYVAAYGYDFITSGRSVLQLFEQRGWATIINDDLISNALFVFAIFMAVIGVLVGWLLTFILLTFHSDILIGVVKDASSVSTAYTLGSVYGGLVGLIVGLLVVSILDSAVAMVYVCFAEDSATLQSHHPETFRDLSTKWSLFQPSMSFYSDDGEDSSGMTGTASFENQQGMLLSPMGASTPTIPTSSTAAYAPYHQPPYQPHPASAGFNPHYVAPTQHAHFPTDAPSSHEKNLMVHGQHQHQVNAQVNYHSTMVASPRPPPTNPHFQPGSQYPSHNATNSSNNYY